MRGDEPVTCWLRQLETGDQEAARLLWQRYYRELVELARARLGTMPRRVVKRVRSPRTSSRSPTGSVRSPPRGTMVGPRADRSGPARAAWGGEPKRRELRRHGRA